ncbi:hypothetical protein A3Q56_06964 [Intoshia linei]|uniref:Uncharacterized protein n=1 Tax=Intoshia linei TaxID=1819745 RepID=A0A177AVB8_9BILA|nr:hypothetical protein A3Q56_06964 [Intoshia linei]
MDSTPLQLTLKLYEEIKTSWKSKNYAACKVSLEKAKLKFIHFNNPYLYKMRAFCRISHRGGTKLNEFCVEHTHCAKKCTIEETKIKNSVNDKEENKSIDLSELHKEFKNKTKDERNELMKMAFKNIKTGQE